MKYFTVKQAEAILNAYTANADKRRTEEEIHRVRTSRFKSLVGFIPKEELINQETLRDRAIASIEYHRKERAKKIKTGEVSSKYNPTQVNPERFMKVDSPEIGMYVHVSWAYKGAVFVIKRIENNVIYLDNPKYKRKELLRVNLDDLRHTARKTFKLKNR